VNLLLFINYCNHTWWERISGTVWVHVCKWLFSFIDLIISLWTFTPLTMMATAGLYTAGLYTIKISEGDRITHGSTGDCRGYRARYFNSWFLGMRRIPTWWMAWHRHTDFCTILIGRIRTNSVVRPRLSSADPPSWCQALIQSTCIRMLRDWKLGTTVV